MNDTSPAVDRYVRERYASMTGEERFLIGARMFDTAREIVLASLPKDLAPSERRRALCRRIYPELGDEIFAAAARGAPSSRG
ncbi:MAG TPA: hypothetical protein VFK96_09020 [Gammaproteobacteria bacterium]|nr:hypothetical protein [Gammaproteobacteria bacterium]